MNVLMIQSTDVDGGVVVVVIDNFILRFCLCLFVVTSSPLGGRIFFSVLDMLGTNQKTSVIPCTFV